MIVGNGMLARAFASFGDSSEVIVFASGVSNSLCEDAAAFERELTLLESVRADNPEALLVYFSTCSLEDPDRGDSPYGVHKRAMEHMLANAPHPYLVLRLPAVIGDSETARTLPLYLSRKVLAGETFDLWGRAARYPIDVDDVVAIGSRIIATHELHNRVVNIAAPKITALDMVQELERIHRRRARYTLIDRGATYDLDLALCNELAADCGLSFDEFYFSRVATKYWARPCCECADGKLAHLPAAVGGRPIRERERFIAFGAPSITEDEIDSVIACLRSRWIGGGPRVAAFEEAFAAFKGCSGALAVSSGTASLHLALETLGIGPGDEVIVPTMTFCATAQAVELTGATPVFVDCDPSHFNCDEEHLRDAITERTRAIIVVHIAGRCVDMQPIMELARSQDLRVVEDCAHALESSHRGCPAGLAGDAGCFSFYATKSVTTGDGGMLVMRDPELLDRARILANHGMTATAWGRLNRFRSGYEVISSGYKYNMTDMEASLGVVQLASVKRRWIERKRIWDRYQELLHDLPLSLPLAPSLDEEIAYHLFSVVLDEDAGVSVPVLAQALLHEGIGTGIHYVPLHMQPYFRDKYDLREESFPHASSIGPRLLSLPLNEELSDSEIIEICAAIRRVFAYYRFQSDPLEMKVRMPM